MTDTPLLDEKLRDGLGEIQTAGMAGDDLAMILLEPFSDMPDAQQCRDAVLDAIHHYYTRALSASRPAMGVKPLEWSNGGNPHTVAECVIGVYSINPTSGGRYQLNRNFRTPAEFYPSLEAAKAAAQADYEQRILSALEDTTHGK